MFGFALEETYHIEAFVAIVETRILATHVPAMYVFRCNQPLMRFTAPFLC